MPCVLRRRATAAVASGLAAFCLTLGAPAVGPASAAASAYSKVLHVYQVTGSIPPCRFSSLELAAALKGVDTYGQQYFADFSDAVDGALVARAAGACTPGGHPASALGTTPQAPLPSSPTSATSAGAPLALLLLAGLTLAIVLIAAGAALARHQGWEPRWAASWRHAWAEAGYRMAGGLADLSDWWRGGRS